MIEPKGKGGLISTGDYDSFCFTPKGTGAHKSSFLFLFICSDGYVRLKGELESERNWRKGERWKYHKVWKSGFEYANIIKCDGDSFLK